MTTWKTEGWSPPIKNWNPKSMMRDMNRVFEDFKREMESFYRSQVMGYPRTPLMDMRDDGDHYSIDLELPGMSKENVTVEIGEDTLFVKAEKMEETTESRQDYMQKERGFTSFYRRIPLPPDVDKEKIGGKMEEGLLHLVLPKLPSPPEEPRKKVEIE